jgi:DAPG hydrolase PhiG domain
MEIEEADQLVTAEQWSDEVEVISPTRLRVAALDRLHGVEPRMIDWFFANLDRERYLAFHPVDHVDFAWVRGKQPGSYVGATHLTHQRYGGADPLMRAEISFINPRELFDTSLFTWNGVGVAVCAIVHLLDDAGTPELGEAGRFAHVGIGRDYGTELRSCWWLNTGPDSDIQWLTERRLQHVHEEFGYLERFLPDLWDRNAADAGD